MLIKYCTRAVLLLFCLSTFGSTQSQANPFLSRFNGTWQGEGKAFGMSARLDMKWDWVLGNKFLRLSLKNEMTGANGQKQVFEGQAYYKPVQSRSSSQPDVSGFEATWFDSRGVTFPIKAQADGDALVALWGSADQEQGKSVYRLLEPAKMEVIDSVRQKDGTWREFGRFVVVRQ